LGPIVDVPHNGDTDKLTTAQGMHDLIVHSSERENVLGPYIAAGHYDLLDDRTELVITPPLWERWVRDGDRFYMRMWPFDKMLSLPSSPTPPELYPRPLKITVGPLDNKKSRGKKKGDGQGRVAEKGKKK